MPGPDKIVPIRHAEKPLSASPAGIDDGAPDPHSLTVRGWQRAGPLVAFLGCRSAAVSHKSEQYKRQAAPSKIVFTLPDLIHSPGF